MAEKQNVAALFVAEAKKHSGENGKWSWSTFGMSPDHWCAAFVSAIARSLGIEGKCIAHTAWAADHGKLGVDSGYGTFHKGPCQGGSHVPTYGDLIFFRWSESSRPNVYACDHVGIVTDVSEHAVSTVEGNRGGNGSYYASKVSEASYSLTYSCISGYFHPNWSLVDGIDPTGTSYNYISSDLYTTSTTKKDMTVREIGYLDAKLQPSIIVSAIQLSVINYTGVLAAEFKALVPSTSTSQYSVNTDKLQGNARIVVDYLLAQGLNVAAACGVAGNIYHESGFNTASVGDNGTSFGICQWHLDRGDRMKATAGVNWKDNLTGQLNYLWQELTGGYRSSTLTPLQAVTSDEAGCRRAADIFVRNFEVPADVDNESTKRQATALEYFKQCVISISVPAVGSATALHTQSGRNAEVEQTIEVPSNIKQTGICRDYTSYTDFYSKWAPNTNQRSVADIWNSKGRKSSRNIATIDNYYIVALSLTFATAGQIVSIYLENGARIDAIVGDVKGGDAGSKWGHVMSGQVSIVEWESIGEGQSPESKIDLSGWEGLDVVKVENRGSYLR